LLSLCCPKLLANRKGETYAMTLTLLESGFPIFAAVSVAALGSLYAYFYSLLFASIALLIWWGGQGRWVELRGRAAYKPLLMTSLFITGLYICLFLALYYTSAANVALILFLQVLFGFLFLGHKKEEQLGKYSLLGALLMMVGAMVVVFPGEVKINIGDGLALLAAMLAPLANLYQKQARVHISSQSILMVRSVIALPFVLLLAWLLEPSPSFQQVIEQFWPLLFVGVLILVLSKVLWIEAIHLLPITTVSAFFAFTPLLTMLWSDWFLEQPPAWYQWLGAMPIILGSILLTRTLPVKET